LNNKCPISVYECSRCVNKECKKYLETEFDEYESCIKNGKKFL
jgi:hypothetical protein